ncbi:MAG: bifunctional adenosylcobinamide kinase/adenosylcobinamide-phosphate guanylyltransferase [Alphaproteobacteria bacterium]|nr:bifunctional adenosylcobinamide kinase/adenosylcobinamide-phosphate guanylyltransferase [Alphaproteobacteria bacterium]
MTTTLILGGARSGKSRRALALAEPFDRKILIATAQALDHEMKARIAAHRAERDATWQTIEEPLQLQDAIIEAGALHPSNTVIVVDCLTLWLSNLMHAGQPPDKETASLIQAAGNCTAELILISNELGLGLVPETELGRGFRDCQGRLNQSVAAVADTVEFVVAGIPMKLKP